MNETISKSDIIKAITEKLKGTKIEIGGNKHFYKRKYHLKYSKEIVANVLNAFIDVLADGIENGDTVSLTGCITVKPKYRKEHRANNVYRQEIMTIPEHYIVDVYVGKKLREACEHYAEKVLKGDDSSETRE